MEDHSRFVSRTHTASGKSVGSAATAGQPSVTPAQRTTVWLPHLPDRQTPWLARLEQAPAYAGNASSRLDRSPQDLLSGLLEIPPLPEAMYTTQVEEARRP